MLSRAHNLVALAQEHQSDRLLNDATCEEPIGRTLARKLLQINRGQNPRKQLRTEVDMTGEVVKEGTTTGEPSGVSLV